MDPIDDYLRIKALIKDEAQRQYNILQKLKKYPHPSLGDIEDQLIAEYMQLEEFSK